MKKQSASPITYFIIVCWNNRDLLEECFETIYNQSSKAYSIICVDNGSTDDSVQYIKEHHPSVTLIENGKNDGFAIGNNLGIKKALEDKQCAYVALLNTDARLGKNWLQELIEFAESHPKGASFQSPTVDYYDHTILDSSGITIDTKGRAMQLGYRSSVSKLESKRVFGVNAAACLYSRVFLEAQPFKSDYFDSDLWMYLEDVDLAARATVMNWENWFVAKSLAYHMGSASSGKNPGFSVYMIYRNNLPLLIKNLPLSVLIRTIPGVIATDLVTLARLAKSRNIATIKALLKGRAVSLCLIPLFIRKRRILKQVRDINVSQLLALMKTI
jgi:GT2 family glycosyltransferase